MDRFSQEGVAGLKNRPKSGRHPDILEEKVSAEIKNESASSKQGWSTKQVEDLIIRKSGIRYHYTHIYRLMHKWGFKQKIPRKVYVNTVSKEEK